MSTFEQDLDELLDSIRGMLLRKREAYGASALEPVRVFAPPDLPTDTAILVRLDDKLSRIQQAHLTGNTDDEDVIADMIGYLLLLAIARKAQK